jgi:hypothetical protein
MAVLRSSCLSFSRPTVAALILPLLRLPALPLPAYTLVCGNPLSQSSVKRLCCDCYPPAFWFAI